MKKFIAIFVALMSTFIWAQMPIEIDSMQVDSIEMDSLRMYSDTMPQVPMIDIFDSMPYVQVYQDSIIYALIKDKKIGEYQHAEIWGFRIQVYSSNIQPMAKQESEELKRMLEKTLPVEIYNPYDPPFFRVRVGNFLTHDEAKEFMIVLLSKYPYLKDNTYIVKDLIRVRQ